MPPSDQNRDLTLQPETYLYFQNEGKGGVISVHRGPTVVNQTGQDQPIKYDPVKRQYTQCSLEAAVQQCPRAFEGDYVILENPTKECDFPSAPQSHMKDLIVGRRVVIPGPWCHALYPGQVAKVVEGHRLRSNQYLMAVIYNSEEAEKNWDLTIVKSQASSDGEQQKVTRNLTGLQKPHSFAVGTRIIIKGNEVSFYIPCTGVEVQIDTKTGKYVRDAVTLEQLEFCCLIDENGKREYPRGPKVVFPSPTQIFEEDSKNRRKFRPVELNRINGLHLKVTADFEDEDITVAPVDGVRQQRKYTEGEELFITGKELQIYYPREELAIIEYGQGNKKHFSTAIPKGEGRYVIERETGVINLKKGPAMLLPDPRNQILVRRIISEDDCRLWYPGNEEAILYNRALAEAMGASPSGRSGLVSEGDWRKAQAQAKPTQQMAMLKNYIGESLAASSDLSDDIGEEAGVSTVTRGTRYTQPRQLSLNTKYDGVPRIEIWPGYAVLVVGASGERRVVEGPQVVLLEYDEKLGFMELSTGKPKSTDRLMKTAYLCVQNNQVSDIIVFESKDHVRGSVKISLRVNFEAETEEDKLKWFGTDNYVKYLTDHIRSILAGTAKKFDIAEIKDNYVEIIRDAILGAKTTSSRPGLSFENGMRVVEVEVLDINLSDVKIAQLLGEAQTEVVRTNIELERARKDLEATLHREDINQKKLEAIHSTEKRKLTLQEELLEDQLTLSLAQINFELKKITENRRTLEASEANNDFVFNSELARSRQEAEQTIELNAARQIVKLKELSAETEAAVARFTAAKDGLYEVLVALGRDEMAAKLAEACNLERWLSGDSTGSAIANILSMFPTMQAYLEQGKGIAENRNRLKEPV